MNGLFVDNNIGEMFNDIISDKLDGILGEGTEFGLGELTINIPTGDELWYNFLPFMVIAGVIIIGLTICNISKKHRKKTQNVEVSSDVEKLFAEAEEDFAAKQSAVNDLFGAKQAEATPEPQPQPATPEPTGFTLNKPSQEPVQPVQNKQTVEDKVEEVEPIKMEKIEVVATKPALKFGKDNNNTTRSGRVFTEEELEKLIRK